MGPRGDKGAMGGMGFVGPPGVAGTRGLSLPLCLCSVFTSVSCLDKSLLLPPASCLYSGARSTLKTHVQVAHIAQLGYRLVDET